MTLRDGRDLAFDDVGDRCGFPVVYNPGFLCSRLTRPPDDGPVAEAGLRLICLDRPGYGGSSPQGYYTLWGWAGDVERLADHLGIGQFAVLGYSLGSLYSLAIADYLDDRVTHGVLVGSPVLHSGAGRCVHWFLVLPLLLRGVPAVQEALPARMSRQAHADVEALVESFQTPRAANPFSAPDCWLLREPAIHAQWVANVTEVFRQGPVGVIPDLMAAGRTERFRVHDVRQHMDLVHGDRDIAVQPTASRIVADLLPDADLRLIHGAGHLCILSHWEQILQALADRVPVTRQPARHRVPAAPQHPASVSWPNASTSG